MVIIQEETTGCGIASVANIIERSYAEVKAKANSMGIYANDESLYSDTTYVRSLLNEHGVRYINADTVTQKAANILNASGNAVVAQNLVS